MAKRRLVLLAMGLTIALVSFFSVACEDLPDTIPTVMPGTVSTAISPAQSARKVGLANAVRSSKPLSGPVKVDLGEFFSQFRTVQGITFPNAGVGATAKQVEVRIYQPGSDPYPLATSYVPILSSTTGYPLVATTSVTSGTLRTLNCPSIPAGAAVIQINVYDVRTTLYDVTTGVADVSAASHLIAQGEGAVIAMAGQTVNVSIRMHRAPTLAEYLHASNDHYCMNFLVPAAGSGEFNLRMVAWNPYTELVPVTGSQYRLRLTLMAQTSFASRVASTSGSAGWMLGDLGSARGYMATQSFFLPDGAQSTAPWQWGDASRKYLYCDIDLTDSVPLGLANYVGGGDPTIGSLSLSLPVAMVPSGTRLYLSDLGAAMSLPTAVRI